MTSGKDFDIVLPAGEGENMSIALFTVRDGKLSGREIFNMHAGAEEDYDTLVGEFIKQYYSTFRHSLASEIVLSNLLREAELIEQYLENTGEGRK